jgi:Ca2+-binding RTX toxin-like protein
MSTAYATIGTDNVTQSALEDELVFTNSIQFPKQANARDYFDGGFGKDTIAIGQLMLPSTVQAVFDLKSLTANNLRGYDQIRFDSNAWLELDASAFDNGGLSNDLSVVNNLALAAEGHIVIHNAHNFSAAAWTFKNWVSTRASDIQIKGTASGDMLSSSIVLDQLAGGAGDDSYIVNNSGDVVLENASEGNDHVFAFKAYAIGSNIEDLTLLGESSINGAGNELDNRLTGNDFKNAIWGMAGNDTMDGGLGGDKMSGGLGDDTYMVDNKKDKAIEADGEGIDTVFASVSFKLGSNVDNLHLLGLRATDGTGNALNNLLEGNSLDNKLDGGLGDDIINGHEGNDLIKGGWGADQLTGGSGSDTFIYTSIADSNATSGIDTLLDFSSGDKINLAAIDANAMAKGNQAFTLDTDELIAAGEIHVSNIGGQSVLNIYTNADSIADMTIYVAKTGLSAVDFIL